MDPEGVREVFYAECGAAADYGVRRALRSLPFMHRCKESFFNGVHLPLTLPLPKRLDTMMAQRTGLHAYDAVILADIDAVVFDADDLMNLQAYVEVGGGLLLMGGPNSFSKAQRGWGPLREALPASIDLQPQKKTKLWNDPFPPDPVRSPAAVTLGQPHPVSGGLTGDLGVVMNVQPIHPKPEALVLASAGGEPVIVAGAYGRGRMLMVAAYPCGEARCMFRTLAWNDLLRQGLAWLMQRDADLVIERCELDASPMELGGERVMTVELAPEGARPLRVQASARRADPGWRSVGREPQWGPARELPLELAGNRATVRVAPTEPGLWQVRVEVSGEKWGNVRVVELPVRSRTDLRLRTRDGEYVTAPGRTLPLEIHAAGPVKADLRILDFDEREVWRKDGVPPGEVDVPVPQLELGDYEVIARAGDDEARLRFCVTNPIRRIGFSMVGSGVCLPTEERTRWWFDYFRQRGFDAFSTGFHGRGGDPKRVGSRLGTPHEGPEAPFDPLAYQHYLVQREGLDLWGEYLGASLVSTHGHYGEEGSKPTRPCVFSPEYMATIRPALEEKFRRASVPRSGSVEILDEPHVMRANVCRCEHCRRGFRDRFGYDMPTWDEAIEARDQRTADYFEWVVDYVGEAFRRGYQTWKSFGPGPQLNHVLCAIGSGGISARHGIAEDLPWAEHADFIEFDCYNYMYPSWRCSTQIRWNQFHYLAGHFRFLTHRNRQRIGFYIQVTDREIPVAPYDPLRAPSETLYTAIGAGAKTIHLMAKGPFTNSQNCREEKFDTFGEDIRKVQTVAPLLDRAERRRSRIAMVFAFHDRLYNPPPHRLPPGCRGLGFYGAESRPLDTLWPNHMGPINVAELLTRAFGETDVIDQRALREGALDEYQGFVLTGVDTIDRRDAEALKRFVRRGGALICDHVPGHDLAGKSLGVLDGLFAGAREHFYRDVTVARGSVGQGATMLFSHDLHELYSSSIEQGDVLLRYGLKDAVREFFFSRGIRPHAGSSNCQVEANVLLTPDTIVLVAVNHADDRQRARITLYDPPVHATCAWDLVTMRPFAFGRSDEGLVLDVDLGEREGLIVGFYPAAPSRLAIMPRGGKRLQSRGIGIGDLKFPRGGRLAFDVELTDRAGRCVRGDQIVEVRVTDPKGEPRRQFGGLLCATNGRVSIDEPLAVNARTGTWTLTAFDRFTTRQVQASVEVTE